MLSYTSGTIEMDFLNIGRRQPLRYLTKNAGYLPGRLQYGIDALRMQKALVLAVNEQPVGLGTAAVGNKRLTFGMIGWVHRHRILIIG